MLGFSGANKASFMVYGRAAAFALCLFMFSTVVQCNVASLKSHARPVAHATYLKAAVKLTPGKAMPLDSSRSKLT